MSALSYPTWDVRGRDRRAARTSLLPLRHWGRVRLLRSFHRRIAIAGGAGAAATAQDESRQARAQQHQRGHLRRADLGASRVVDLDAPPVADPVRPVVGQVVPHAGTAEAVAHRQVAFGVPAETDL